MPKIQYLHKTRQGIPDIYAQIFGDILQNMNFSRYYRNRGKFIYGFDPNIIKYTSMELMYNELKERRVYINKTLEEKLPLMASAVYESEQMQLILMIWGLPWQRMTLAEANRLTVIGALIQNTVVRANRYLEALRERRYVEETNVLDEEAFAHLTKAFFEARDKGLTECSLLEVTEVGEYDRKEAAVILGTQMRQTDYLGILHGSLYALLSNTDQEGARSVMERFSSKGYHSELKREAV